MTEPITPSSPLSRVSASIALPIAIIVAIGGLYVGRDIFVPLVMAVLVTFALVPVVRRLEKLRVPHVVAVLVAVLGAVVVISAIAYLIVTQLIGLAGDLPQYQQIVSAKLRALQQTTTNGGVFDSIANLIQNLGTNSQPPSALDPGLKQPIPVAVVNPGRGPLDYVAGVLESLLGPLATTAIVVVFVIFLLLEQKDFRDRFLKLVSRGDLRTSTKVMSESGKRVSRYLLVQFLVNILNGVIFGLGVWFIGIPNAILWGILAALFRYIPFVGTLIGAAIPFALAFAIDPGWSMLIETVVLYSVLELAITNGIEPRLYGSSTGLSALAVLVAAIFWSTLWGPIGLILSTPLTVCLVVIGRYVPQLQFLEVLLGDQPVLVAEEQLYQRLLSGNVEEAVDLAESQLAERSAQAFYDDVAVPALRLAEADRVRNLTDVSARRAVVEGMAEVVREVEHFNDEKLNENGELAPQLAGLSAICIGGRSEIDAAAADMLSQIIARSGVTITTLPPVAIRPEGISRLDLAGIQVVCIVYVGDQPRASARFVARRIKRRNKSIRVLLCVLSTSEATANDDQEINDIDSVVRSITAAETQIIQWHGATHPQAAIVGTAAAPDAEKAAEELGRFQAAAHGKWLETLSADAAKALNVQIALISIVRDGDTAPDPLAVTAGDSQRAPEAVSILPLSDAVVAFGAMLVIDDTAVDSTYASDPFFLENGTRFFAGIPLKTRSGTIIGTLCVLDGEPREFTDDERVTFEKLGAAVSEGLEEHAALSTMSDVA